MQDDWKFIPIRPEQEKYYGDFQIERIILHGYGNK